MPTEIVRVLRIVEYVGEREWVEATVKCSIHGTRMVGNTNRITAVTISTFPELVLSLNSPQENTTEKTLHEPT